MVACLQDALITLCEFYSIYAYKYSHKDRNSNYILFEATNSKKEPKDNIFNVLEVSLNSD
jgi:hypothetical protein